MNQDERAMLMDNSPPENNDQKKKEHEQGNVGFHHPQHEAIPRSLRAKTSQNQKRHILMIVLFLGLIFIVVLCLKYFFTEDAGSNTYPLAKVALYEAEFYDLPMTYSGIGELEAESEITLASEASGRIVAIYFESGEFVQEGQLLLQLNDQREISDRQRLMADQAFWQKQVNRFRGLAEVKAIEQSQYDEAVSRLAQIDAMIAEIEAVIAEKHIRAPFSGVTGIRKVHLGEMLHAGDEIVTLVDDRQFKANFTLDEKYAGLIQLGQPVTLLVSQNASSIPLKMSASISAIDPKISDARLIAVQAKVPNDEELNSQVLKSGMFVKALVMAESKPALMIPETSLTYTIYGSSILIAKENEEEILQAQAVRVEIGERYQGFVEITKGLKLGDKVVVSGQHKLSDGALIIEGTNDTLSQRLSMPIDLDSK